MYTVLLLETSVHVYQICKMCILIPRSLGLLTLFLHCGILCRGDFIVANNKPKRKLEPKKSITEGYMHQAL